jgi:Leu/Phe-tRNA-protein transferase
MIRREGFTYERFDLTELDFKGGFEDIGNLIIGIREGQFPQFEQKQSRQDWQQILGEVLTPEELEELGRRFGRKIGPQSHFWPRADLDFWEIIETVPTFESKSGKRFWVFKPNLV